MHIPFYMLSFVPYSVSGYVDSTKSRIKPLLESQKEMSEEDMEKFGKKDPEAYPLVVYEYNISF